MRSKRILGWPWRGWIVSLLAVAVICVVTAADARQVCLPGTGLDCGGAPSPPSGGGSLGGAAAGLGAAADIFSAIGTLLDASQSLRAAPESTNEQRLGQAEQLNEMGLQAYSAGEFDAAIADFMRATTMAADAHAWDLRDAYTHNTELAQARKVLSQAEALYQSGDYAAASRQYLLAAQMADRAGATGVAGMVRAYHQRMMAAAGGGAASQGVLGTDAHCEMINGTMMCETPPSAAAPAVTPKSGTAPGGAAVRASAAPSSAAAAPAKVASPKFPVSTSAASSLPPWQRWMVTGSPADCAAARALDKTTAGWYDMCVPVAQRGGSSAAPAGNQRKTVPVPGNPASEIPGALANLLRSLPPASPASDDDGRECGHWSGHRERGQCFAPWDGKSREACEGDLGGTYYPASADNPTPFCASGAAANPLTANDGEACGDAGGHIHDSACWIMGVTHSDCDDLHGKIVESGGYQYCAYDPTAVPQAAPAADNLRDRLRKSLNAGGNGNASNPDDGAQAVPPTGAAPKAPAAQPQQIAQKTMTPADARKACAALGSKWRYDPTATYNFSPGAPPKCFPIFTDSLEGEPGFATKP